MRPLRPDEMRAAGDAVHACWNSIGVRGDKSCPALAEHAHCRNCPTYAAAAATLLDRPIAVVDARADGAYFAEIRDAGRAKDRSAILFRIGPDWFALATLVLDEVVEMRALHTLPHRRSPIVRGIVNVRGELVACVSLARLLGIAEDGGDGHDGHTRRLLVLRGAGARLAVAVDEVQHTRRYHDGELSPPPATLSRSATSFTRGLLAYGDRLASSLDETRLLDALARSLA